MNSASVLLTINEVSQRVVIEGPVMWTAAIVLLLIAFVLLLPWIRSDPV